MADLSDVLDSLAATIAQALYPSGAFDSQGTPIPSAAGPFVKIMRGTPSAKQMDEDLRAGIVNVTVNERPGVGRTTTRFLFDWQTEVTEAPSLAGQVIGQTLKLSGDITAGQGVLIIVDGQPYAYQSEPSDNLVSVISALTNSIAMDRSAIAIGNELVVPGVRTITYRNVVQGKAVRPTRQQEVGLSAKIFAPNFALRDAVGGSVDNALSITSRLLLNDGSVAMVRYSGTTYDDRPQKALTFIRTLFYQAEYSTVQTQIETTIGVVEAVMTQVAANGAPSSVGLITDVGPAVAPSPSELKVIVEDGGVVVDSFGNPEVEL